MDNILTFAGCASASRSFGWTLCLAKAYNKNPSWCPKLQWFNGLSSLVHLHGSQLSNTSSWRYQPSLENQAFFFICCGKLSEIRQLRHVLHKRSRKQHTTSNTVLTEIKSGPNLPHYLAPWQSSCHPKQPSKKSQSSWKDQHIVMALL